MEEFPSETRLAFDCELRRIPERNDGPKGLQRNTRPAVLSEVKTMQQTITEQAIEPGFEWAEPEVLRSIRADARIRSVVIFRTAKPAGVKQLDDLVKASEVDFARPNKAVADSFLVTDLLEDITYLVGQAGSLSQLVFTLKNEQVMVAVQPGSDLTEIAHDFARNLEAIRANT